MEKIECDRCRGEGTINVCPPDDKWYMTDITLCPKCKGLKKLDWVEMIVGVGEKSYRNRLEELLRKREL